MQSSHTFTQNATENFDHHSPDANLSLTEQKYQALSDYLVKLKKVKNHCDAQEHEQIIVRLVRDIGQAAIGELFENYDVNDDMIQANHQTYRRKHKANKTYQTAFGPVTLSRHVYVNRKKEGDGKSICPLEMQAGFIGGYWSPMAAKQPAFALAHLTPQETEDLFLTFGSLSPSRSSLDRLPKLLHQYWEPQHIKHFTSLMRDESVPAQAKTVAVSLDGVMVGMKPEKDLKNKGKSKSCDWKEASCGTVSFFDANGERLSTIQYGRMLEPKKTSLKTLLKKEIELIQEKNPSIHLVHIADGAQDNWTFFDEAMPLGFQLTDFYHACQYLKAACHAAYSKQPEKAIEKFNQYKTILRDEQKGVRSVLRTLRYLKQKYPDNHEVKVAVTYFTNNQHRMKYAEAKAKHYPIGSGIVEAACKTLVGGRLKRSGMSWHIDGGQAILNLRSLVKSHRFDRAWEMLSKSFIQTVNPLSNVVKLFD